MENVNFDFSLLAEDIKAGTDELLKQSNVAAESMGLFLVKPGNKWIEQAKTRPIPKMLFSELWHEGELCIMFADTNLGKSILAVQIGNSISRGEAIPGFKLEAGKQPILYFDFELSDKQFEARYAIDFKQHYTWNDNFLRAEINPDADVTEGFEAYLERSLDEAISKTGAKVLIIDNITYLKNETEKAKDALPLMKNLKALKSKHKLSILALAHTPKRDSSKPITKNDLQGSKMLINFCDSAFAIGESSTDKNIRYLKQIKERATEKIFDSDNVCLCQITKPANFLQFEFLNYSTEGEHLKQYSESDKAQRTADVLELKKQGSTNVEIAKKYGVSETAVRKWIKKASETETPF